MKGKHRAGLARPAMRKADARCPACSELLDIWGGCWLPWFAPGMKPVGTSVCWKCSHIVNRFQLHRAIVDLHAERAAA